jgi:uracil-DNA glycosylase family 4
MMSARERARMARELRQRLQLNRLFGWDVPLSLEGISGRGASPGRPGAARPAREVPRSAPRAAGKARPASEGTAQARETSHAERLRREALLEPLRGEVAACTACDLCHSRTRTVFGVGDPTARLLFVGEAPGFDEDRQGEPFVGQAGQLLTQIIKAMGLARGEVYIANVIKCRPPQNRPPNPAEVGACRSYLERQVEIVRPEVIIALGTVAAKALLETDLPMSRLRGRFFQFRGIPVLPTYHPAYLLRNPGEKVKVWEDVQQVMARLGLRRPGATPS